MKKLTVLAILFALCSSTAPVTAQSVTKVTQITLTVNNNSDRCAWITLYSGRLTTPWLKDYSGWLPARNATTRILSFTNVFGYPVPAEIKVRAEFRPNGCSGSGGQPDTSNENKGLPADQQVVWKYNAHCSLEGGGGTRYYVTQPRQS